MIERAIHKEQVLGIICALSSSTLFGFSFLAVKLGVADASVFTLLSWRFILAFLAMTACVGLGVFKIDFRGKRFWPLAVIAFFQPVVYFIAETYGIQMTSASESGTIIACIPLLTLLLMPVLSKENPTRRQWISIAISVGGVILVGFTKGEEASFSLAGYLFLLLAALSDAVFLNLSRRFNEYTGVEKSYVMAGCGAVIFTAAALVEQGAAGTIGPFLLLPFRDLGFLLGCLYLSVGCSVAAFILRNVAVSRLGPGRAGSFAGVTTLVSVLAGVLLLHEGFSLLQGVGTLLVLLGVYGANTLPRSARLVTIADPSLEEEAAAETES